MEDPDNISKTMRSKVVIDDNENTDHDDWMGGRIGGKIYYTKDLYYTFVYRYYHKNSPIKQHSRSFRLEDYANDATVCLRAAKEYRLQYNLNNDLIQNRYRIEDGVVTMQLALVTASVPSMSRVSFSEIDLPLVTPHIWYHDEFRGAVCNVGSKSRKRCLDIHIFHEGNPPVRCRQRLRRADGDWKNHCRVNLISPHSIISAPMVQAYHDIQAGRNVSLGIHQPKHKRIQMRWYKGGKRQQKTFCYGRSSKKDADEKMKKFILETFAHLGNRVQSFDDDSVSDQM